MPCRPRGVPGVGFSNVVRGLYAVPGESPAIRTELGFRPSGNRPHAKSRVSDGFPHHFSLPIPHDRKHRVRFCGPAYYRQPLKPWQKLRRRHCPAARVSPPMSWSPSASQKTNLRSTACRRQSSMSWAFHRRQPPTLFGSWFCHRRKSRGVRWRDIWFLSSWLRR